MRSTGVKVLGSDKDIKLGYIYGKMLGNILGDVYEITLGIDIRTELGTFDGSFDGSNDGELKSLSLVNSLRSTDGKVLGYDEDIKMWLTGSKVLGYTWKCRWNNMGYTDGNTLTLYLEMHMDSLGLDVGT